MDNTLLVALSHQIATYKSMDVIANNLANVSTPAFKRESVTFEEYVADMQPAEGEVGVQKVSFVKDTGVVRDISEGRIDRTGAPFDVAIHGSGYFQIETKDGTRYTRNGHFTLDGEGKLVTSAGDAVSGDGGSLTITPEDGDVLIARDGTISGANGIIGKIKVVNFDNERELKKEGASLYSTEQAAKTVTDAKLIQGSIETSNVQPVIEISHMIEVMRAYQATANLTQSQEDMKRRAITKLGEVAS